MMTIPILSSILSYIPHFSSKSHMTPAFERRLQIALQLKNMDDKDRQDSIKELNDIPMIELMREVFSGKQPHGPNTQLVLLIRKQINLK